MWLGELDSYEPDRVKRQLQRITSQLSLFVEKDWSHDFGPDAGAGFLRAAGWVRSFLVPNASQLPGVFR